MNEENQYEIGGELPQKEEQHENGTEISGNGGDLLETPSPDSDPASEILPEEAPCSERVRGEERSAVDGDGDVIPPPREGGLRTELLEFGALYPDVKVSELPREVRESELPLAAAYALYEKKNGCLAERAAEINRRNAERSAGGLASFPEIFYSPEEVRRMSQKEVRDNYEGILRSMKRWQ